MDGRQEYSLERSRLLAAGLVMTPGYVEPPQPSGPSSLLRGGLTDIGRSAPPPPHPSPGTPGLSSAAAFQQYGRCLSSIPSSAGTNFQSFLNGVFAGSMPAPASSPYRAPPGVPSIRHLWPPVPPTPEDYERCLPSQSPTPFCSQYCRCQRQMGYGRCSVNGGLYSLFPMVSSSDSSSLYSQASLSRLASSQNSFQHMCENPKDLMFPSGIQLSTMIPPTQHLAHSSPSTPSLQELERNGLSQMEYYAAKGLENGTRRSVDLWSDLRTRNDNNNNTMPNSANGLLSPHSHPYQSHGSKKREQHVRHLERKSEATDERRGLREGGKKPREIKQESGRKEDAAVCKKPHCNDDVIAGRQPESYAARCTPLHGEAPGSSGREQGGKAVATPAPAPGPQPDKRSADPETARDSPVKTEKPSADKCQVRTQATVTVTTTTLTQSSGGTNTLTTTPSPRDNEYPPTPYAQLKTTATKVVSSVLTTSSNSNISSSNKKDNLKEQSIPNTELASVPSGNTVTTSQTKHPDTNAPTVNHTSTSLNGVTSSSPVVISNTEKQWKGVQTVKPVLDKTENKHSSLEIPQKSCTSRVVIKQETTYESSCVSGRKFSTAIDTSVSIRSSTGKDCMFVNSTSHRVNSDIKNSDRLCNSQSSFIGQRQTNTLSKSSANVLVSKKDPHTKQNKRKVGKLYPIHSQYSRNTVHKETVKLHDNSQTPYCDIVSNCCLPKSPGSLPVGTAAKVDSNSHSNYSDIMSISERQSVTSLQTMIAGTDHPQAALISVPETLPSTMTDQSCTTSALPPQYVFEWSSPQFSTASVTTLTTHPSYLIQHSSQTLHPDANTTSVTACTCTQGPIIVQTIPKTVIATTVDNASSDLLVNSHPPDHIILSHRASSNNNTNTTTAHEVKDMTSALTQVVPVSVLTDNISEKTDLSKVQEQSTNEGPLLLHNPTVACSIPIGIAVARQRQEHSPSHTPIKRNEETITNEEPTTDNCGAIDLRGDFLRDQKEFLPRPKQPHTTNPPAELGSSIIVPGATTASTGQWDDSTRTGTGLPPPWVPAPHSSAYWIPQGHYAAAPAPIPMQIGTMETSHLPIPPVGYQLVRDSITGHLLLIPANIDLMDRPTMWPTYATPATHLQSSHQLQQLIVHQQLLQQDQHRTMEYRLAVPQQFPSAEITKNQNTDMQNVEEIDDTVEDCSDQNEQCENMQQSGLFPDKKEDKEKSALAISAPPSAPPPPPPPPSIIASIPIAASQTFPFAFPAAPYFYEAAGVVQLAQAVQTDTGRRSQGTSPVLPDDCISMPIEQSAQTMDDSDSCESDRVGQEYIVTREEPQVADASNQTETPPLTEEEEDAEDLEGSQVSNGSEIEKEPITKQDVGVPCDSQPSDNEVQPSEEEEITNSEPLKDMEVFDSHGLELLSNSIKVHEESHLDKMPQLEKSEPESELKEEKIEIKQPKLEPQEPLLSPEGESSGDEKPPNIVPEGESPASLFSPENSMLEGIKTLGGLKLLCALAEQKFLDENLSSSSNTQSETGKSPKPDSSSPNSEKCKNSDASPDLNRNYRNPKTQKEFKNFFANKMTQYMQPGAKTPPGNDNLMDAAELEMRMRLADLQKRYKEKQRELAKLQPKKEKEECEKSPVKRGPGRPRKRKFFSMAKKMQKTSVENLVKNVVRHEISQSSYQSVIDEPSRKKKKKQGKLFNPVVCMPKSSPNSSVNKITNKPILKPPLLKANNLHNPTLVLINNKAKKLEEPPNATSMFHSTAERTNQLIKSKYGLTTQQSNPLTISTVKVQILSPVKDTAKNLNDQPGPEENTSETVKWVIENKMPTTESLSPSKTFGNNNVPMTNETPKKENTDKNKKVPGGTSPSENGKPALSCESPSLFDKSDGLGLLAQFATHVVEQSRGEKRKHKETEGDAVDASKSLTTASLSPSLSSSSKKRKPGRPKKHSPSRLKESTETIVAKKPKNINFLKLSQVMDDKTKKVKVKTETNKSETKAYYLEDEAWNRRRSERIFLNELNIVPSGGYSETGNRNILSPPHLKPATEDVPTWKTKTDEDLKPPKNLTRAPDVGKNKKKTTKGEPTKKQKTKDRQKRSKDRTVPEELFQALKEKCRLSDNTCGGLSPRDSDSDNLESSSYSEGENLPLSQLVERPITPEPRSCIISSEELADKLRVLTLMDGLFYAGHVNAIQAPDVYGITFDGERGNRPHIYSREEILKKVFLEVKPGSVRYLPEGTRISAYWSQQYRCLYPGTVAKSTSPNPVLDKNSVYVEFDDGDSGRIPLNDIRLLPPQFPIVSYDPSPLVFLGKRRSRSTQDSDNKNNANTEDKQKNSHKFNKMEDNVSTTTQASTATSVTITNSNASTNNTASSGSSKERNGEETKKKSKKLKSESREKSRKSEDSNVNDNDMPNEVNKPKKHKKHRDKDRPEEHRHHHHHHHHHHKHKHRHDRHEKHGEEKESFRIPSSSSAVTETHKVITTVTQQMGNSSDPKKSEFTMKFKTNTADLGQFEPSVTEDSETCNTWESSESSKMTDPSAETSENSEEECAADSNSKKSKSKTEDNQKSKKRKERLPSVETKSKIAAFLPARQLWRWSGKSFKRPGTKGKAKKEFYKAITRGKETIMVGDCAVFLSTGRPHLPYIGRIEMMWEAWGGNMVVKVKWFYHPEETKGGRRLTDLKGALYQSPHVDENDVQTISHKCEVLSREEYKKHRERQAVASPSKYESSLDNNDVYYLAGTYDPTTGMVTMEPGIC